MLTGSICESRYNLNFNVKKHTFYLPVYSRTNEYKKLWLTVDSKLIRHVVQCSFHCAVSALGRIEKKCRRIYSLPLIRGLFSRYLRRFKPNQTGNKNKNKEMMNEGRQDGGTEMAGMFWRVQVIWYDMAKKYTREEIRKSSHVKSL